MFVTLKPEPRHLGGSARTLADMLPAAGVTTPTVRRSARFTAWVRAWRAGLLPSDDAAVEIAGNEEHIVADAPGTWTDVSLAEGIRTLAQFHPDRIRLVLPVPGDPRGLPGPGPFSGAALVAEEGVIAGDFGYVPEVRHHTSGSGMTFETILWRMYPLSVHLSLVPDEITAAQAEAELLHAIATATRELGRLDVARWRPELSGAITALRKPDRDTDLPPGYDPRSRRLYARASVLDRVLALAEHATTGGAVTGYEAHQRDAALRPLLVACRRALVAACNAPLL